MANASDVFNDEAERQNLASTPEFADDVERLAAELAGYTHCAPLMHVPLMHVTSWTVPIWVARLMRAGCGRCGWEYDGG